MILIYRLIAEKTASDADFTQQVEEQAQLLQQRETTIKEQTDAIASLKYEILCRLVLQYNHFNRSRVLGSETLACHLLYV